MKLPLDDPHRARGLFDDIVTVTADDGEAIYKLGGPAQPDANRAYYDSWDVPRWAFIALCVGQSRKSWVYKHGIPSRARFLTGLALKRGARDPDWAAALVVAFDFGGVEGAARFIKALEEPRGRARRTA